MLFQSDTIQEAGHHLYNLYILYFDIDPLNFNVSLKKTYLKFEIETIYT